MHDQNKLAKPSPHKFSGVLFYKVQGPSHLKGNPITQRLIYKTIPNISELLETHLLQEYTLLQKKQNKKCLQEAEE